MDSCSFQNKNAPISRDVSTAPAIAASPIFLLFCIYEDRRRFKKAKEIATKWAKDRGMTLIDFSTALNPGPFKNPTLWEKVVYDDKRKRYFQFIVINENGRRFQGWAWYKYYSFSIGEFEIKLGDRIKL